MSATPVAAEPLGIVRAPQQSAPPPTTSNTGWIIGRWADLLLFVATPLLVWPLVQLWQRFSPAEQIWLVAISFASFGHHLPGFLRAYLDADLFSRFRVRLLLVPPLIFATCLWCEVQGWHGLRVLILLWATWHGLMQTYGFLRIYDLKRGAGQQRPLAARLDFALCVMLFVVGMIGSDARLFALLGTLAQAGWMPPDDTTWLTVLRWLTGVATGLVVVAYLGYQGWAWRRGLPIAWSKLALAATTGWIWWISGAASTNVLVGIAMFEIVHAVQYLAIVWVFNKKAAARPGNRSRLLTWLFQGGLLAIAAYLLLIALFGAIRFWGDHWFDQAWLPLFAAFLGTSTLLHYYFDGFIWKVRERGNQSQLEVQAGSAAAAPTGVSGALHAVKWLAFFGPLALLCGLQVWQAQPHNAPQQLLAAQRLAGLFPYSAGAQLQWAEAALLVAQPQVAAYAAQRAVQLNADDARTWAVLGGAHEESRQPALAAEAYRQAVRIAPHVGAFRINLAGALADQQQFAAAETEYQQVLQLQPNDTATANDLTNLYAVWAEALAAQGQYLEALQRSDVALARRADWAALRFRRGVWCGQLGRPNQAITELRAALQLQPHDPLAQVELARQLYQSAVPWLRLQSKQQSEPLLREARELCRSAQQSGTAVPPQLTQAIEQGLRGGR